MHKETLSADEMKLLALVREVKDGTGHGELVVQIQEGHIKIVKQTKTIKL